MICLYVYSAVFTDVRVYTIEWIGHFISPFDANCFSDLENSWSLQRCVTWPVKTSWTGIRSRDGNWVGGGKKSERLTTDFDFRLPCLIRSVVNLSGSTC